MKLSFQSSTLSLIVCAIFLHLSIALPFYGASAQSSNCTSSLTTLLPCLGYIESGNTTNPGSDCCTPLGSILASDPSCVCQIAPLATSVGFSVNDTRALEVVTLCNQTIPTSVLTCLSSIVPEGSPSSSPTTSGGTNPSAGVGSPGGQSHGSALLPPVFLVATSIWIAMGTP